MSLRDKAREIKAEGEARRGDFTPRGKPLELYRFWREVRQGRGKDVPERENFCHYWRVVVFWAPMWKLLFAVGDALDKPRNQIILAVLAGIGIVGGLVTGSVLSKTFLFTLLMVLGTAYFLLNLAVGAAWGNEEMTWDEDRWFFIGFPLSFIVKAGFSLPEKFWLVVLCTILGAFVTFVVVSVFLEIGWWILLVLAGLVAVGSLIVFGGSAIVDFVAGLLDRAEARREAKWAEEAYENDDVVVVNKKRKRGFFGNIADFIVLVAQVVRVNKWKICPLAEIPDEKEPVHA